MLLNIRLEVQEPGLRSNQMDWYLTSDTNLMSHTFCLTSARSDPLG